MADERKAFLRILSSLAWADGVVAREELEVLHLTANELSVALTERDLEERDLAQLAATLTDPELRRRLLDELARLALADEELADEELATIKFFAETWDLPPPSLEGVDWDEVTLSWAEDADHEED